MSHIHLVIVESPAKGKTIEKYLGPGYRVLASYGHVRDLPASKLGVDTDHHFAPHYIIPPKAKKALAAIKKAAAGAEDLYLATDYDREGEAIAWHIVETLGFGSSKAQVSKSKQLSTINYQLPIHRITFHEITQSAIAAAIKHPRAIDMDLVNAQQARRVFDRLVGYTLSPFLWKKVMKGLSAGRVQSVAVRLIVDREVEIRAFKTDEYWSIDALLKAKEEEFSSSLVEYQNQKIEKLTLSSEAKAKEIEQSLAGAVYTVASIEFVEKQKRPSPPFTTSTLQQQAAHRLYFSAKATMALAQNLYEAGHITYMRTDSTHLADEALTNIRSHISNAYGPHYVPEQPIRYKTKSKGAQEAHEAIRPTDVSKHPDSIAVESERHRKLYQLIWQRAVASQMKPAILKAETVTVQAFGDTRPVAHSASVTGRVEEKVDHSIAVFKANGNVVTFDGYLRVWPTDRQDSILPKLTEGQTVDLKQLVTEQHFTEPPARYSEASLVKALEERGIGRPSTYAPTLSTIEDRGYVRLEERRFHPTEVGETVTALLVQHFPDVVDYDFTAEMEENLDAVAEGKQEWTKILGDFWSPFAKMVELKTEAVQKIDLTEPLDRQCPHCQQHNLIIRQGRYGKFIACPGFPDCRYTERIAKKTGVPCSDCKQGELVEKKTRKGKVFWGCERYPDCKAATWIDPTKKKAPEEGDAPSTEVNS
ncbi:type I DNA topoisomerase [Candidatus Berkelbacteria bacterium]|nr:type I DNA topoisomerase [Candidatus Berkelbacteria bacterium]